jgi:hypothetical protein
MRERAQASRRSAQGSTAQSRDTDTVRAEPVDPRMDSEWGTDPTVNYRVIFWISETRSSEYDLLNAEDVHAAIAWADAEAQSRSCTYGLYAKVRGSEGAGLVWLAGIDPSANSRANFERPQPLG